MKAQDISIIQRMESAAVQIGSFFTLLASTLKACVTRPFYFHKVIEQIVQLGFGSMLISGIIGFVIGLVMTLQFGHGLNSFGGTLYVPSIVAVSLMRELAPILTSLLLAGRIGSGIAAEVGSMNVTQQIDAIRAMGTSPVRVLVVPRFLGSLLTLPLLTIFSAFTGLLGGMIISSTEFGIPPSFYIGKVVEFLRFSDVLSAMIKGAFFSILITITACHQGFRPIRGTRGVGISTTKVVVSSSIAIMVSDFFLSKILLTYLAP